LFSSTAPSPTAISTLSLHDALPISRTASGHSRIRSEPWEAIVNCHEVGRLLDAYVDNELEPDQSARIGQHLETCAMCWHGLEERSEEHTSELQSRSDLVCRLLLEKK